MSDANNNFADYRPRQAVLKRLHNITLVAVVGPSGVGKTTLIEAAVAAEARLQFVPTTTSRPPRSGEQNGVDYNFRPRQEMLIAAENGELVNILESATGDLYGTEPDSFPVQGIGIMAIVADVMPYFRSLPFKEIRTVFILPPSFEEWQRRIAEHHFNPDQLAKRWHEAARSLVFALTDPGVMLMVNKHKNEAAEEFRAYALGKKPSPRAKKIAQKLANELTLDLESVNY